MASRPWWLVTILLAWLTLACAPAWAATAECETATADWKPQPQIAVSPEERSWLQQHRHLRVVTKTEWAPIDLYTYEGQFRGLSGDYLAAVARRLGLCFEYRPAQTLADALQALREGSAEVVPSVSRTPEREAFMDFTQAYLDVPNVYVGRRGVADIGPGRPMEGLRVAVERGYAVEEFIRIRHPLARIVEYPDSAAALRGVSEAEADVYLGALPTTSFLVEKLLLTNLEVRGPWHSELSALHLGVRKGDAMLLALLDRALADIPLAEREEIHRRWVPLHSLLVEPSPPAQLPAALREFVRTLPGLRVGFEPDYKPYTFQREDGRLTGMAADYMNAIADKTGLRIGSEVGGTWTDVYARARRGELDLLIAIASNEERQQDFVFVGPWISTPNVLVTPRQAGPVLSMSQYVGRTVAVLKDGQTAYLMRKLYRGVRLLEVPDRAGVLAAVVNGQADAAVVNATLAAPALAEGLAASLKMAAFFPELNSDLYLAVRKDQQQLAQVLRLGLASLTEGERAAIASRWAVLPGVVDTGEPARRMVGRIVPVLGAALVAVVLLLLWGGVLRREVARRARAESELRDARDRAEDLARQRREFLAEASHEIRTPVNAVLGALGQMPVQELPPASRELVSLARRAAQTLSEYVNNLLDLSKADAGELRLVPQPDSLAHVLQSAVDAISPIAVASGVDVRLAIDARLAPRHQFDAFRLGQVVLNLLSNAVKYGVGRPVEVEIAVTGGTAAQQSLALKVRDHGLGIREDHQPLLFQPYSQAGESLVHRRGGTGLGLALCKRLVDAMGGRIELCSALGQGTVVTVQLELPVADVAPPAGAPCGLRVLLVEDDRVQQIVIEAMLRNAGCEVDVADSGLAAQPLWTRNRHRLVLTDLHMPHQDGSEFADWLRTQSEPGEVLVVATSAEIAEDRARGRFRRLLHKPVSQAQIDAVVAEAGQAERQAPPV